MGSYKAGSTKQGAQGGKATRKKGMAMGRKGRRETGRRASRGRH